MIKIAERALNRICELYDIKIVHTFNHNDDPIICYKYNGETIVCIYDDLMPLDEHECTDVFRQLYALLHKPVPTYKD